MSILCMKTRTCILLIATVIGSVCLSFILIRNDPSASPTWDNIVSETQKQLNNLKQLNQKPGLHKTPETEPFLRKLGLDETNPSGVLSSDDDLHKILPKIVIPVLSGQGTNALALLKTIRQHLLGFSVIIYDLGLGFFEKRTVRQNCNVTANSWCQLRTFEWGEYPSHVSELKYGAYRPIIIQEILNITGAVFFFTPYHRITSNKIESAINLARKEGVAAWPMQDSTSAITHHKVYHFFNTEEEKFYFHRTVSPDRLLIYNTPRVAKQLMLPWIQCALTSRCVAPIGAQDSGCRTYRKPLFLYSGCHGYDWSVLNIVLGLMFHFDSSPYLAEPATVVAGAQDELSETESDNAEDAQMKQLTHEFFVTDEKVILAQQIAAEKLRKQRQTKERRQKTYPQRPAEDENAEINGQTEAISQPKT